MIQDSTAIVDTFLVGRFAENALRIFEAAESIGSAGPATDTTILISSDGRLTLLQGDRTADWALDSLRSEHGAAMAYRVRHGEDRVHLEGCSDMRSCRLEAPVPVTLGSLLNSIPQYVLA